MQLPLRCESKRPNHLRDILTQPPPATQGSPAKSKSEILSFPEQARTMTLQANSNSLALVKEESVTPQCEENEPNPVP